MPFYIQNDAKTYKFLNRKTASGEKFGTFLDSFVNSIEFWEFGKTGFPTIRFGETIIPKLRV